jgi:hypothetical protein
MRWRYESTHGYRDGRRPTAGTEHLVAAGEPSYTGRELFVGVLTELR